MDSYTQQERPEAFSWTRKIFLVLLLVQILQLFRSHTHEVIIAVFPSDGAAELSFHEPQPQTKASSRVVNDIPRIQNKETVGLATSSAAQDEKFSKQKSTSTTTEQLTTSDNLSTFSACLLIMDDNYRLDEWIAYHWHVMPLRYMVVAVDPRSKTTPTSIFDKWREFGMTIVEWTDDDYLLPFLGVDSYANPNDKSYMLNQRYLKRQEVFYSECTRHLMNATANGTDEPRSWTIYTDIDEFVTINLDIAVEEDSKLLQQPGSIRKMLHKYKEQPLNVTEHLASGGKLSKTEQGWYNHFAKFGPCMAFGRAPYSAVESSKEERAKDVPSGFTLNPARLDTLRFRYRGKPRYRKDGPGKAFIDVSKVTEDDLGPMNAHKPLRLCPKPEDEYKVVPIGIHHYLGSWEAYSYRDDARRGSWKNFDDWEKRALLDAGGADDELRPWLAGFVGSVGLDKANALLESAGLPIGANKTLVIRNGTSTVLFQGDLNSVSTL